MSFRRRMILLAAGAVAAAVVIASVVVYVVTRDELRGQIDASLRQKLTPGQPQAVQFQAVSSRADRGEAANEPQRGCRERARSRRTAQPPAAVARAAPAGRRARAARRRSRAPGGAERRSARTASLTASDGEAASSAER